MDLKKVSSVLDDPGCKVKYDKLIQMRLEETQIGKEIVAYLGRSSQDRSISLDEQARLHLQTGEFSSATVEKDRTLEELYERRRINARAVKIARDDYEAVRVAYSRQACAAVSGLNRELAQRMADALTFTVEAAAAIRDFVAALQEKGIVVTLPSIGFPFLGFTTQHPTEGMAARWISDQRKAGLIR
jgi:hypothetical protein